MKVTFASLATLLVVLYLAAISVEESYYPRDNYAHGENPVPGPVTQERFDTSEIEVDLRRPWDIEFLPDGSLLATEQLGSVKLIRSVDQAPTVIEVAKLTPYVSSETGVLGLAIDPDFQANRYVYVYLTVESVPDIEFAVVNQIDRYRLDADKLVFNKTLLSGIPGTVAHSGGRLEFGPDNKLYATIGDGPGRRRYRDLDYLGAKILRMNSDGSVPEDNPIAGSLIYTIGHRNPQGISWHPVTGQAYASEHGPSRHDEINQLQAGQDYGWDTYACHKQKVSGWRRLLIRFDPILPDSIVSQGTRFPLLCAENYTLAPSGVTFVDDARHPWFGDLFVTGLHGQHLRRLLFDASGSYVGSEIFYRRGEKGDPRLRDVEFHNGSLYVIGESRGLTKLTPK